MTIPNQFDSHEHFRDLQLAYLEGRLAREEIAEFHAHLAACPHCAEEVEELRKWLGTLRDNKEALCPKLWEIHDAVQGNDPTGELAIHLKECPSCRKEAEILTSHQAEKKVPEALWTQMQERLPHRGRQPLSIFIQEWFSELPEKMSLFFQPPVLALSAVAAAVLVIVVLLPPRTAPPVIALSSVKWEMPEANQTVMGHEPAKQPGQGGDGPRKRFATVILFNGFAAPVPTEKIDSLYRVLSPTSAIAQRFDVIPPHQLQEAVRKGEVDVGSRISLLKGLHEKLAVPEALLLTITAQGNVCQIRSELVDTKTRAVIRQTQLHNVTDSGQHSSARRAAQSALEAE